MRSTLLPKFKYPTVMLAMLCNQSLEPMYLVYLKLGTLISHHSITLSLRSWRTQFSSLLLSLTL